MKIFCVPLFLVLFFSCQEKRHTLFTTLPSTQTGLHFQNTIKEDERHNVFDFHQVYNGAGVAVGDLDGDGLPDLYFTGNMVSDRLYRNKGNLEFEDITEKAGIVSGGWSSGVTMADINADGRLDIYVSKSGNYLGDDRANQLYINQGEGKFEEMAQQFGLADTSYTNQAAFFDFDKDGDLDVYLITTSPLERKMVGDFRRTSFIETKAMVLSPTSAWRRAFCTMAMASACRSSILIRMDTTTCGCRTIFCPTTIYTSIPGGVVSWNPRPSTFNTPAALAWATTPLISTTTACWT
jgi:hypothetical protein